MVEVGSGMSTAVAVAAREMNRADGSGDTEITCVEPFPRRRLLDLGVRVIHDYAQSVPLDIFESLNPGDLLFIDSTHAVHTGSDVVRLFLEVIPRLPPGITIHVHDIYFPYMYNPHILTDIFDWQETALLGALLINNEHLKVVCSLSALCHARPDDLHEVLPDCRPAHFEHGLGSIPADKHFPSSTWLETLP